MQFAREGIRVNALCPGPVDTPLLQELFAADPERAQRRLVHIPMGRFARAEEIAATVAFLASDDASFITASHLPGGRRHLRGVRDAAVDAASPNVRRAPQPAQHRRERLGVHHGEALGGAGEGDVEVAPPAG